MLVLVINKVVNLSYRSKLTGLFMSAAIAGFAIPYVGFGAANIASAASTGIMSQRLQTPSAITTVAGQQAVGTGMVQATTYAYSRLSLAEAYPFYAVAAFMVASGISLYALSYLPGKVVARSRYASRFTTLSRTSY